MLVDDEVIEVWVVLSYECVWCEFGECVEFVY